MVLGPVANETDVPTWPAGRGLRHPIGPRQPEAGASPQTPVRRLGQRGDAHLRQPILGSSARDAIKRLHPFGGRDFGCRHLHHQAGAGQPSESRSLREAAEHRALLIARTGAQGNNDRAAKARQAPWCQLFHKGAIGPGPFGLLHFYFS